jgi:hypothetical protein
MYLAMLTMLIPRLTPWRVPEPDERDLKKR